MTKALTEKTRELKNGFLGFQFSSDSNKLEADIPIQAERILINFIGKIVRTGHYRQVFAL